MLRALALHHVRDGFAVLTGVTVAVRDREVLAVVGPRGSGKTTLLRCLAGQLRPDTGELWFNSKPLHTLRRAALDRLRGERFGWIGSRADLVPELTARENTALPLLLAGHGGRRARERATDWLERLDVAGLADLRPAALDPAQRQRVALARALVREPSVLFADEPTAALHRRDGALLLRALATAARSHGLTVVLAGPDTPLPAPAPTGSSDQLPYDAVQLADRTVRLVDGRCTQVRREPGQVRHEPGHVRSGAPDRQPGAGRALPAPPDPVRAAPPEPAHAAPPEPALPAPPEPVRAVATGSRRDAAPCSPSV
ncbi:ATP-binding cassette domain-containing protein [Streptomyces sp. XM4193]|nr:ATP-binding cassette domain-containing protein [Streptomyces sp. XM4193]MCK1798857.1 ATP-binding cassette domain-containing protein [Streptomyces sp. XM4193]